MGQTDQVGMGDIFSGCVCVCVCRSRSGCEVVGKCRHIWARMTRQRWVIYLVGK